MHSSIWIVGAGANPLNFSIMMIFHQVKKVYLLLTFCQRSFLQEERKLDFLQAKLFTNFAFEELKRNWNCVFQPISFAWENYWKNDIFPWFVPGILFTFNSSQKWKYRKIAGSILFFEDLAPNISGQTVPESVGSIWRRVLLKGEYYWQFYGKFPKFGAIIRY